MLVGIRCLWFGACGLVLVVWSLWIGACVWCSVELVGLSGSIDGKASCLSY